jgi:hypothetical protein
MAEGDPTPTPEPVMNLAQIEQAVVGLVTTTVVLLKAFGVWQPSEEQLVAMLAAVAAYIGILAPIIQFRLVRARVVPLAKVAAVKEEYVAGDIPPVVDTVAVTVEDHPTPLPTPTESRPAPCLEGSSSPSPSRSGSRARRR